MEPAQTSSLVTSFQWTASFHLDANGLLRQKECAALAPGTWPMAHGPNFYWEESLQPYAKNLKPTAIAHTNQPRATTQLEVSYAKGPSASSARVHTSEHDIFSDVSERYSLNSTRSSGKNNPSESG